jgi:ferric-dicitrate binding protein FerR (iron transport regulator)
MRTYGIKGIQAAITRRETLVGAVAISWAALQRRAWALDQIGKVVEIRGTASAETSGGTRPLAEDGPVFLAELLRTGDESRLGLHLGLRTSVRLGARSKLRVDRYIADAGGEIIVDSGQLLFDGRARRGLTVRSPYALIAVRGTKFFAGQLDSGFSVFVARGAVSVSAAGTQVILRAGDGTDIAFVGAPPSPAKKWGAPKIARAFALVV